MLKSTSFALILVCTLQVAPITAMHRHPKNNQAVHKKAQMHKPPQKAWPTKQENAQQKKLAALQIEHPQPMVHNDVMMVTGVVLLQQLALRR